MRFAKGAEGETMKKEKYVTIELTDEQLTKLEPLIQELIAAHNSGAMGMLIGQTGLTIEDQRFVKFGFIEAEQAVGIIKIVNPKMYEWNVKLGLIKPETHTHESQKTHTGIGLE